MNNNNIQDFNDDAVALPRIFNIFVEQGYDTDTIKHLLFSQPKIPWSIDNINILSLWTTILTNNAETQCGVSSTNVLSR